MNFLDSNGNDVRQFNHLCKNNCGTLITSKKLICDDCKTKESRKQQELKFENKIENIDFLRCKLCRWPDSRLGPHIRTVHNYTKQQYKKEFNSKLNCLNITKKTAFTGKHSETTKQRMSDCHKGQKPWNTGLTKNDHASLASIASKAAIRLSQLHNNNWHTNPISGERSGRFGQSSWCKNLNNETSEILAQRSEKASGIYSHKFNLTNNDVYNRNHYIREFRHDQKDKVRQIDKICIECGEKVLDTKHVHHIYPEKCFDFYDLSAHSGFNLISLCGNCHSSIGQRLDNILLACNLNIEKMKVDYPLEFIIFEKWLNHANKRNLLLFPISKNIIQILSQEERANLSIYLLDYFKTTGFPLIQYDDDILISDFDNVKKSIVDYNTENNELRCYNSTGSKIREHFIKEQYSRIIELYNNDDVLLKIIRNRLGLDWTSNPEFFNIHEKTIITGFKVLYPQYCFTQYSCAVAKWIIDNFCKSNKVYDYAAGWGSRMIAAAACNKDYIGVDTNKKLVLELQNLSSWLSNKSNRNINILCENAANFDCGNIEFAYSCPPYGIQEKYNNMLYKNDDEWFNNYMKPVIRCCTKNLIYGGRFVCHISKKLAAVVKNELDVNLTQLSEISFINHHHVFNGGKERANEVIFVYEK